MSGLATVTRTSGGLAGGAGMGGVQPGCGDCSGLLTIPLWHVSGHSPGYPQNNQGQFRVPYFQGDPSLVEWWYRSASRGSHREVDHELAQWHIEPQRPSTSAHPAKVSLTRFEARAGTALRIARSPAYARAFRHARGWGSDPRARRHGERSLQRIIVPVVADRLRSCLASPCEAADGRIHAEETLEGRFDVAVIGGVFMVLAGLSSALSSIGIVNGVGFGWFQLLALAAAMTAIVVVIVRRCALRFSERPASTQRSPVRYPQHGAPQYGMPQYGMPQNHTHEPARRSPYGAPQNHTPQNKTSAMGASAPRFDQSAPAAKRSENTMHPHNNTQSSPRGPPPPVRPQALPAHPQRTARRFTGCGASVTASPRLDTSTDRPSPPRPAQAGRRSEFTRPRQWTAPAPPTHSPRTVSARANLTLRALSCSSSQPCSPVCTLSARA